MVEDYLQVLNMAYFEVTVAFEGLADENVWKRPTEGLLSIGELAGHIAYWEAVKFGSKDVKEAESDLTKCGVSSPLIDTRFRYYPTTIATPPSEQHLEMTSAKVSSELLRVHQEAMAHFKVLDPDLDTAPPGYPPNYTYRNFLMYASFHVSYHTGQMYTVRHLLGEQTPDN